MSQPANPAKFYHALNASSSRKMDGMKFFFDPYQYASGTWWGIFKTESAKEQEALAKVVASDKSVTEITEQEYLAHYKKKYQLSLSTGVSVLPPAPPVEADRSPMMPPPASRVGEPSISELPVPAPSVPQLKSAADALAIDTVSSAPALEKIMSEPAPAPHTNAMPSTTGCDLT